MKKIISTLIPLLLILLPVVSHASSLILLKNGGQVVTSFYWFEGSHVFFYYAGGTAGIERKEIAGIRRIEDGERQDRGNTVVWNPGIKDLPPEPPPMKKAQQTDKPKEAHPEVAVLPDVREEKVDFAAYKKKKEQMRGELDGLLERQRQAAAMGDEDAKNKIKEEMIKITGQIDKLTDEVKEKNKGKLPDGWWGKQ